MTPSEASEWRPAATVLIVTHQLSRTGAPVMMLSYARWLASEGHPVEVLALRSGPLAPEFGAVARLWLQPHWVTGLRHLPVKWARRRLQSWARKIWIRRSLRHVGVVHANTITCGEVAADFAQLGLPVVSHIHELESVARNIPLPARRAQVDSSVAIVCVSEAVRQHVARSLGVAPERMTVVPSMAEAQPERRPMRRHPGTRFTVGGCGSLHWRKGSDLFLSVAYELVVRRGITDVEFVWLGGDHDSDEATQRTDDLVRLGLEDQVRFAPPMNNPAGSGWYESLDAFLLTSREDPFPLVIHEAAAAGVPIVGFAGCGGFDEFASDGEAGVLVPFGDCAGMSAVLADWIADRESARRVGEAARARWRQDYDPQVTAARLWAIDVQASMVDARAGARESKAAGRSVLGRLLQAR